ncbi:predicted protein, partial [Nematostella vectensis]
LFPTLDGRFDRNSELFQECKRRGEEVEISYKNLISVAKQGGGESARQRHTIRNKKLLVRERISRLLDKGSDFLEFSPLAGLDLEYGTIASAGVVSGIGRVSGNLCVILANDATVKAGTLYPIGVKKQLRAQEIAEQNRLPLIFLVDSGGAFLPLQAEIFPETGGRTFYNEAVMSSCGVPVVCVVCGSCTAGAAYVPTMAEETVIIDKIGTIFLGGPPLVKVCFSSFLAALKGQGHGTAHVWSHVSGCTDHFATDEKSSLEMTRQIVASLNRKELPAPSSSYIEPPLYQSDDLVALSQFDKEILPIYQIISRIVDGSRFQEFKAKYGPELVCGFAHIYGNVVGVVANNGSVTSQSALKGAHFIGLCCQRDVPLVFLQNTTSPQRPLTADAAGQLIKDMAKMIHSVACAQVPKFTIIMGGSYGPESFAMCGRSFDPRFIYTWPSARVAMDSPENLTKMALIQGENQSDNQDEKEAKLLKKYDAESGAYYGTARLWDDGVILPQDTRKASQRY